ncbi:BatA and WFA domain-containing protein [Sulfidibacter corallicola]|uniref:BatA and WFA domain-containing protein n=1 Tax=Sulfidibacter corallicola TaxID=2818388 RepID=A0A8A4TG35_SULCO|nr:BatA and WFA domain-containing protein [Sulfidibacter corallicola]QTD47731.1 BatA and WFA domain-containing protein [Sulfidibacter corallicola]
MSLFNISFLAPLAFLGLLALAIPIYLHMRHKPRAERYRFPAIDFLLKADKKRKRRFRVEQMLLMLFRIMIVCLLAILFAKPYVDEKFGDSGLKTNAPLIVLLDDSVSMMAAPGGERLFEEARLQIRDLLERRAGASPTRLILAGNPEAHPKLKTADQVLDVLPRLKPTTGGHTLDAGYEKALAIVREEGWNQAILRIITDGSLSAWRQVPVEKPSAVEVIYASVRGEKPLRNLGLSKVDQAPGDTNSIEVSLQNGGDQREQANLILSMPDGTRLSHPMRVDGFAQTVHRFGLEERVPATLTLRLPSDDFDLDNEVVYAPRSNRKVNILVVDGDSHPEAIHSESFFFKNALGLDESDLYGYALNVVTPAGLDRSKTDWADVICMLNADLPQSDMLTEALDTGKGVMVTMGERMDRDAWNQFFSKYGLEMWEAKSLEPPRPAEIKQYDHPLFSSIDESDWRGYLDGFTVGRFTIMTAGQSGAKVPIALADGTPLLLTHQASAGRLAVWASSADLDWNSFALSFGYVPFVRQIVAYLSERDENMSYQGMTVSEVLEQDIAAELNPKYIPEVYRDLDIAGPLPGIYTRQVNKNTQFIQVRLDPEELNFKSFEALADTNQGENVLEQAGFRSFVRAELAPQVQWLLFALILVETCVAARVSLNWGGR